MTRVQNLLLVKCSYFLIPRRIRERAQPLLFFFNHEIMPKSKPIESFEGELTIWTSREER